MEIIIAAIVLYLLWLLITKLIIPMAPFVIGGVAVSISLMGAGAAIFYYICAIIQYANPYIATSGRSFKDVFVDSSKHKQEYVRRKSYFFGPGFFSLKRTISCAWSSNFEALRAAWELPGEAEHWYSKILYFLVFLVFSAAVLVAGTAATLAFSAVHCCVILTVMLLVYLIFSIVWIIDRIYLKAHSINSMCPYCKARFTVPAFACTCGKKHTRLVPSSYGVFHHKCVCGKKLPTTFFNGRSKYRAFCPVHGEELASSGSRQFGLTMIGGSSSGKTVYLAAYFNTLFDHISRKSSMKTKIPDIHMDDFQELSDIFYGKKRVSGTLTADSTKEYSVILEKKGKTNVQFTIFDVAGEVFDAPDLRGMTYTNDMRDSNGILLMLDPFSSEKMQQYAKSEGVNIKNVSKADVVKVINSFATHLRSIPGAGKVGQKITRPIAVIITKMDYPCMIKKLSRYSIGRELRSSSETVKAIDIQDKYCYDFLLNNGFSGVINALEANFSTIHFFPVSASGGAETGAPFDPDDYVLQPVHWLVRVLDPNLADDMGIPDEESILKGAYGISSSD